MDFYPDVLKGVIEFRYINTALEYVMTDIELAAESLPEEHFFDTCSDEMLTRYERMLGLDGTYLTTEERITALNTVMEDIRPYTLANVQNHVDVIAGQGNCPLTMKDSTMIVRLALSQREKYDEILAYLEAVVPANILIDMSLAYNTYGTYTGRYEHEEMADYTYQELRDTELGQAYTIKITGAGNADNNYLKVGNTKYYSIGTNSVNVPAGGIVYAECHCGAVSGLNVTNRIYYNNTLVASGAGNITYRLAVTGNITAKFETSVYGLTSYTLRIESEV